MPSTNTSGVNLYGWQLRILRQVLGLSQKRLACDVNVRPDRLCDWESRRVAIPKIHVGPLLMALEKERVFLKCKGFTPVMLSCDVIMADGGKMPANFEIMDNES